MKRYFVILVIIALTITIKVNGQSSVYWDEQKEVYGFCYGEKTGQLANDCAIRKCRAAGGTMPTNIGTTAVKGWGCIVIGTNSGKVHTGKLFIGAAVGCKTKADAIKKALTACNNMSFATNCHTVEIWNDSVSTNVVSPESNEYVVIQGKKYRTKKIGNQTWMLEDLMYETPTSFCSRRGFDPNIKPENPQDCINNKTRYYSYSESVSLCPAGWRIPTKNDWRNLLLKLEPVLNKDNYWDQNPAMYEQVGSEKAVNELIKLGFNLGDQLWLGGVTECKFNASASASIICFSKTEYKDDTWKHVFPPYILFKNCEITLPINDINSGALYTSVRYVKD